LTQQSTPKAALFLAAAALLFSIAAVVIRSIADQVNNENVVFFRNLVGFVLIALLMLKQGVGQLRTQQWRWHLIRSCAGLAAMYCFFYAIAHMALANAMLFTYAAPVFVPLLAFLLVGEPIKRHQYGVIMLGFVGVLLVVKPEQGGFNSLSLVGMACTLLSATAFVSIRKLSFTEKSSVIVFYYTFLAMLISAIPMLWAHQPLSLRELLALVFLGVLTTIAQWLMTQGYRYAPAAKVSPVSYLAVVFGGILAWLLWDEIPDSWSILGIAIVFAATLLTLRRSVSRNADA